MSNVPTLRFKEFSGEWEKKKFKDIVRINQGLQIAISDRYTENGENRYFYITNEFLNKNSDKKYYIENPPSSVICEEKDILMTRTGNTGRVVTGVSGAFHNNFFKINYDVKQHSQMFLYYVLTSFKVQKNIIRLAGTSTIPDLNHGDFYNIKISYPILGEQEKIASFFSLIDKKIELQTEKVEELKNYKKGIMQKMFPRNGETVPELRFAGFTNDWEQRKFGALADIVRGASPRPIQDPKWFDIESEVGWLRISDVTEQDGRIYHLEQRISKLGQQKTRVLNEPHLLLSIAATVGKPVVNYVKTGVHDGFLIFLNPKFDREFMFQWLEMFRPMWQRYGQPGSQVNLNSDLVKNQEIVLPSIEEQVKIGEFLSQFDKLITLHQCKLDALNEYKKGLLQQMFI